MPKVHTCHEVVLCPSCLYADKQSGWSKRLIVLSKDLRFQAKYNCAVCRTRCDSTSKSAYIFQDDVLLSAEAEDWLTGRLSSSLAMQVRKTIAQAHGLPDLELVQNERVVARVEVKAQGRAFMLVQQLLPHADLRPYETVALNLSDLERYISYYQTEQIPTFIIWRVRRPCLGEGYWGQHIEVLQHIRNRYGSRRRFRRRSTTSDYVDGQHKGVTVNYHFSLQELVPLEQIEIALRAL